MKDMNITFDEVFKIWMDTEVGQIEGRDLLPVAQAKGFSSITEWRLNTALRLGMDKKEWVLEAIGDPNVTLPNVIIGPYQGWSKFFDNRLDMTFLQAMEIPDFFEWCRTHDRVMPLSENFPQPTSVILFRKENGELIHIEGGHRMCAIAFRSKLNNPIEFKLENSVTAAIATITDSELGGLIEFLKSGTFRQS